MGVTTSSGFWPSTERARGPASDEVTGSPLDTIPPELLAADVRGTKITLTYNKTLDDDSVPTGEAFGVTVNDDPDRSATFQQRAVW